MSRLLPVIEIAGRSRRAGLVLFGGLALGLFASELAETIFATALPTVAGEVGQLAQLPWITTAYLLASTVVMPVYGKLSDLFGRRRMLIIALGLFLAGSVAGGLASGLGAVVLARVLQGLGAGGLLILVQAVVADLVAPRQRIAVMSGVGAVFAVAAVAGPPLGGWLTEQLGWRSLFWLNLPLGLLAVAAVVVLLPSSAPSPGLSGPEQSGTARSGTPSGRAAPISIDVAGAMLLSLAVSGVVLTAAGVVRPWGWSGQVAVGVVTAAALVGFVVAERRAPQPLVPLRLFRRRNFSLAVVGSGLLAVAAFGTIVYLPTYLQMAVGLRPTVAGLLMLSLVGGLALSTVTAAAVVRRTGRYKPLLVIGSGMVAAGLLLLSTQPQRAGLLALLGCLFLLGAGIGCAWETVVVVAQTTVSTQELGTSTAVHSLGREIGVCVGTAAVGGVFTSRLLTAGVAGGMPASLTPELLATMPEATRVSISAAYVDALSPTFALVAPLAVLAAVAFGLLHTGRLRADTEKSTAQPAPAVPQPVPDRPVPDGPLPDGLEPIVRP